MFKRFFLAKYFEITFEIEFFKQNIYFYIYAIAFFFFCKIVTFIMNQARENQFY